MWKDLWDRIVKTQGFEMNRDTYVVLHNLKRRKREWVFANRFTVVEFQCGKWSLAHRWHLINVS